DERTLVLRDEVLFKTVDKLPSAVVVVMTLFAVVNVPIFLKLGGLAPGTDVSDDHGVLLTSAGEDAFLVNHSTPPSAQHYMECTTQVGRAAETRHASCWSNPGTPWDGPAHPCIVHWHTWCLLAVEAQHTINRKPRYTNTNSDRLSEGRLNFLSA